jgi:hypothetical protein|tara:strand:- start:118 stop:348 length:231 start_codon:yes stop_codon:yes gene_type:complete
MNIKGLSEDRTNIDTPNDINESEKPLSTEQTISNRVDINVLKAKLEAKESKEFRKNVYVLSFLVLTLAIIGIYFSL